MACILFGHRGHPHDAPRALVTQGIPREQTQEASEIETVRLGPSGPPIDFDARGIDDVISDAHGHQVAMQPEAIAASLVTTGHRGVR